jgi:heme/copper-type cytochrome/quinol oxidase subunit 2
MEGIVDLYSDVMAILVAVAVLVGYLLIVGLLFWDTKIAPHSSKSVEAQELKAFTAPYRPFFNFKHLTALEFAWTLLPCILLLIIAVPSFTLALALDEEIRP